VIESLAAIVEGLKRRSVQLVVDVSNAQGQVDWAKVAGAGVHGAFYKASEGAHFVDAFQAHNRAGAARAKIHAGAYHFARPDLNDPHAEADHFAAVLGTLHPFELVPALDLEVAGHVGADDPVAWARAFNRRLREHLGVWPLFYSYSAFIEGLHAGEPIGGGLWLANYGRNDGAEHPAATPKPWRKTRLHQFTSAGRIAGVRGRVDLSHTSALPLVGKAGTAK
jgi:lysozyme